MTLRRRTRPRIAADDGGPSWSSFACGTQGRSWREAALGRSHRLLPLPVTVKLQCEEKGVLKHVALRVAPIFARMAVLASVNTM